MTSTSRPLGVAVVARAVMPLHGLGGLERSVRDLVTHLAYRNVLVTLITPPPSSDSAPGERSPFDSPRIRLHPVPYRTFPFANRRGTTILDRSTAYLLFGRRAGRAAGALVREGAIDIVHGFGAAVLGYAQARRRTRGQPGAAAGATAPLVFNPQGLEEFGATAATQPVLKRIGYGPLRRAVRACARAADRIIVTDAALEPMVRRHLSPAPDQLCTIPNGIDLADVDAHAGPEDGLVLRRRHALAPDEFVLLSVGRLEANKGFDVLARALGRAASASGALARLPWRWVLVGSGPGRRRIEEAVRASGIGPRVLFAGRASERELHAWYEAASLFVHPTLYEGSSLVTLEAMAHRKPVIASRAGGLPDKVRPGVNGWLVDPGDETALTDALGAAAAVGDALAARGRHSRAIVEREFAWTILVDRQLAVYRALLSDV